ncbi:MAG: ATP-dependent zinc metalloprotease FtsH [Solirubrobacterales bacterium]|nr:ATP-dependent zinc metalloprotease FtsH [Solirubrobacterales bacterium]MBV9716716.1 ATP-dependent zinc metalloprotease FtsH [Solirubrobacterales bacterium]
MADDGDRRGAASRPRQGPSRPPLPGWRVTPPPEGRGGAQPPAGRPPSGASPRWLAALLVIALLVLNLWISSQALQPAARVRIPYSPTFLEQVRAGNVKEISSTGDSIQGTFRTAVKYPPDSTTAAATTNFSTQVPSFADRTQLSNLLQSKGVIEDAQPADTGPSFLTSVILGFGPTLLLLLVIVLVMRRAAASAGGPGGLMSFGRSRARRVEGSEQPVTFKDVAGIDEAKEELTEIVDFLKNPEKYARLGGRIPRGVLLSGAPGTGKTLLARAVAGEAGVPFFQMSASEFVEMIVGVGASRVRDLFAQAKAAGSAIIFIDELDAVGRSRSAGGPNISGGHDEREQTLNQILTEMDGFDPRTGVIVLGATNRPEILDPALLRPGRFDRRVAVQPPDRSGREAILRVHTRSVPLAPEVNLGALAASTPGMVGADLANLVNEAALLAARRNHDRVTREDFSDALERIVLGAERKVMLTEEDRRRTAYHEAGHAIVGMLTPGADPVRKVSIIPRGQALGVTFSAPDADRFNFDQRYLTAQIDVALGGRVAEELVFGDVTTGAESDIQHLTRIARHMVGRWGMSPAIGPIAVIPVDGMSALLPGAAETSESTQRLIDEEVRRIVDSAHTAVTGLLRTRRANLDALAGALLDRETLDEADAYAAAGLPRNQLAQPPATQPV